MRNAARAAEAPSEPRSSVDVKGLEKNQRCVALFAHFTSPPAL